MHKENVQQLENVWCNSSRIGSNKALVLTCVTLHSDSTARTLYQKSINYHHMQEML